MACPIEAMSAEEIRENLSELADWQVRDTALERVYKAASYLDGLAKLNAIAQASEAENHHPELLLEWKKLTVRYWTHTAHGITALDFRLAQKAEVILSGSG